MSREVQPTNGITLLVFLFTGYAIIFAQAKLTFFRDTFGAQPDLLPGMIVFAAMAFRVETVMLCAAILGVLLDAFSLNTLGVSVVSLGAIGFAASRYRELLLSEQFTTHWVLGLIASGIAPFITYIILRLSGMYPLVGAGSAWHWAITTAGGGLVTPLWFKVFNRLDDALRFKEIPESTFRADRQIARGRH
ncbi:MAG TPA: rod shape-determining protein MreD [Candidatus Kapabacteria bacterium]|nr:rod shape-determining protein MreD [Candidatus Kapabacteria bacterium]